MKNFDYLIHTNLDYATLSCDILHLRNEDKEACKTIYDGDCDKCHEDSLKWLNEKFQEKRQ